MPLAERLLHADLRQQAGCAVDDTYLLHAQGLLVMSAQPFVAFAAHLGGLLCQGQAIVALDKFDLLKALCLPYIHFGHIDQLLGKLVGIEAFATAEGDPFGRQTYGCYVLGDERKGQCIASGLIEQTGDELLGGINLQDMFLYGVGIVRQGLAHLDWFGQVSIGTIGLEVGPPPRLGLAAFVTGYLQFGIRDLERIA